MSSLGIPPRSGADGDEDAERVGLEPTHGLGPPTAFPGRPLVQLGYLSRVRRDRVWRRAGESNSQAGWSPAVRFRSGWAHLMPRPSRSDAYSTPGGGPDQVRTGGLRLDGATGTPLPYEAVTGTPPGGRTLTTGVRVRHAGHYVRGVLVGAAGLAPARHSEAALQAAAFAARPHPQVAGGRGGPTAVLLATLHRWLVSSG